VALTLQLAHAQSYPAKPIRLIVPWPPGGTGDIIGRIIGQKLNESLQQPVVVDNRGGAGGNIGTEVVTKSPADGYTLLLATMSTHSMNQFLYSRMAFDPINDLAPISLVADVASVLVAHPSLPANNVKELITLARSKPRQLNFASGSSFFQLSGELFNTMAQVEIVNVPYKGGGPAVIDLMGGQVEMLYTGAPAAMPHVKSGRLKIIAVTNSKRSAALPDVPTIAESLPGYELNNWYGFMAPLNTPRTIVNRLNAEIAAMLARPEVAVKFLSIGADPLPSTPERFLTVMKTDAEKSGKIIKAAGLRAD
jgi:tripartite-type tricarboxylate transporter receptor subunit TctC